MKSNQLSDIVWRLRNSLINERKKDAAIFCALGSARGQAVARVMNKITIALERLPASLDQDVHLSVSAVQDLEKMFTRALPEQSVLWTEARKSNIDILQKLSETSRELSFISSTLPVAIPKVIIPVELIYQIYSSLFPAERMIVTSGRKAGKDIRLGAAFDVTGKSEPGHVAANPVSMGNTLMAMEKTGSYFASWWHSHPGKGEWALGPSQEDHEQYSGLVQHYSKNLLGVIMVADGWLRFWGDAVVQKKISLEFIGNGLRKEGDNVYRLED